MASITTFLLLQLRCQLLAPNPGPNISPIDRTSGKQPQLEIESRTRSTSVHQVSLPAGYVAHPEIGFAYKIHNETATFPEAEERCKTEGGHLATIDSQRKLWNVWTMRQSPDEMYVGIFKIHGNNDWVSIRTGSPVHVPWGRNEPSGPNACVTIESDAPALGNYNCDIPRKFVCERRILQENLIVQLT